MSDEKVVLVGVGSDSTNIKPVPDLKHTPTYDYIPIPETWLVADQYMYSDVELNNSDETSRVAADEIDAIRPFGTDGDWITDDETIRNHPVHYDPNFEALTYGDKRGRGGRGSALVELNPGDGLGFYTGIDDGDGLHRYIWGYFTVREVADLGGLGTDAYRERLRDFPENAHAKRLAGAGKAKHEGGNGSSLVIVDGKEPGGRLERPVKISTTIDKSQYDDDETPGNTYWLSQKFISEFNYDLQHHSLNDTTGLAGLDIKHALHLDLGVQTFQNRLAEWQSEQY